ncbi:MULTISPECIES: AAA family ATPase [Thioalkalivibrio]|uniref:ATPase n=1 Tax=Thioalkalivibrio halophilus TaxID=252474 RepID=A0A1V2ZXB4_9GAMM|nr:MULTISPECIES: AAA family ATPase [Thioalkalivibrio]OOC09473.1 ATPase [Thioalkalivibrio halophilus]
MRLQLATFDNFRLWERLEVELGSRLTLLMGENGSGKTAILDGVAIGLGEILKHLPGVTGIDFRKRGEIHQSGNRVRPYTRVTLKSTIPGLEWERVQRRDRSRTTAAAVPTGPGVRSLRNHLDEKVIDPSQEDRDFEMPVVAYYGVSRAVLDIPLRRRNFPTDYSRFDALVGALEASTRFKSAFAWFYFKENEEHTRQKAARSFDVTLPELDAVRRAITRVFPDLSNPRIEVNPLRLAVDKEGETFDIAQLSDGYQTLLGLIMDLAARMAMANPDQDDPLAAEAVVMIDEVDLHLHPAWQRRVVGDLLATFPRTQFILTTHSPYIVEALNNHLQRYRIEGLVRDDGEAEVRDLMALDPADVAAYGMQGREAVELLDGSSGLLDDRLLQHFNEINQLYDRMRDIEWEHGGEA